MKILLVGNYAQSQQSMQRFTSLMHRELVRAGCDVRVTRPIARAGRFTSERSGSYKWLRYVDTLLLFRRQLRAAAAWADIVHICDQGNAGYVSWLSLKPNVVTCHDLLAIRSAKGELREHQTRWTGRVLQRWTLKGMQKADHVACVSSQTHADLLRISSVPPNRASVILNAVNRELAPLDGTLAIERLRRMPFDASRPYFLHVGGNDWYKNREGVLRIFRHLAQLQGFREHRLVMVGKAFTNEMRRYISRSGLGQAVVEMVDAPDEALRALYCAAEALIFPSLYEGFGWPILEAQICGCPVATTNRQPMLEVGGDAAIYIDPDNESGSAMSIAAGLTHRADLVARGVQNSRRFAAQTMISGYLQVYESAMRGH